MALFKLSDGGWSKSRTPFKSNYLGSGPSAFSDSTLATITYGESFSDQVVANAPAGSRATRYNITSGSLPSGLVLDSRTGVVSGTSDASESYAFTVTASNPNGSVSESYTGATADAPTWSVNTLGDFTDTVSYSDSVSATARPAATYSVSAGSLPPGISLNTSNGTLSGAPSGAGNAFSFTITATNIAGSVSQDFSGNILQNSPDFVYYLVVAGGGNSGSGNFAGGGGAGGYRSSWAGASGTELSGRNTAVESPFTPVKDTAYTVTVGGGGSNSTFASITSTRGGYGNGAGAGGSGGSGGGAGDDLNNYGQPGGSGTAGQGFNGQGSWDNSGGAGGVASGNGNLHGGPGLTSTITGSSVTIAGGGGGSRSYATPGDGRNGGGNGGQWNGRNASSGSANTGGGAGGGSRSQATYGGSGVVVLRFPDVFNPAISAGLTYSSTNVDSDTVLRFTGGTGTITW